MLTHEQAAAKLSGKKPKPVHEFVVSEWGDAHVQLPLRIVSEANASNGTRAARMAGYARKAKQKQAVELALCRVRPPPVPCVIRLVRIAPATLDSDNIQRACKAVRDRVAKWLGIDDRDLRVYWAYGQTKVAPRTYGLRIEWWPADQARVDRLRQASGQCVGVAP